MDDLTINKDTLISLYRAATLDGAKLPFRVLRTRSASYTYMVTFIGVGWSLLFSLRESVLRSQYTILGDTRLYGDRDRFLEDYILARMKFE